MPTSTTTEARTPTEKFFEQFLFDMVAGDTEAIAPKLHEEIVWHLPPFAQQDPIVGKSAVRRFLAEAGHAIYEAGSLRIEPELLTCSEGQASCLATIRGKMKNGTPYKNRYGFFARLCGAEIAVVWEILDSALLLEQMRTRDV